MIQLTTREMQAVQFLSEGLTFDEICNLSKMKKHSLYCVLSRARKKLGIKTNHQLVVAVLTLNKLNKQ